MVMTIDNTEPLSMDPVGMNIRRHYGALGWNTDTMMYVAMYGRSGIQAVVAEPKDPDDGNLFLVCSRLSNYGDSFAVFVVMDDGSIQYRGGSKPKYEEVLAAYLKRVNYEKKSAGPKPWYLSTGKADLEYERG